MYQENEKELKTAGDQFSEGGMLDHDIGTPVVLLGPIKSEVSDMEFLQLLIAPPSPPADDICTGLVLCSELTILLVKNNFGSLDQQKSADMREK